MDSILPNKRPANYDLHLQHRQSSNDAERQLVTPLLVAGVGSGLFIAANADFIVATVESADAGAASGVIGTMQRVGSAIGIAVIVHRAVWHPPHSLCRCRPGTGVRARRRSGDSC